MSNPKITFWIARVSGSLSVIGSSSIIYIILSDFERKMKNPKNRILLLMSVFDISQSVGFIVGTAAFPRDSGLFGAVGSDATCTIQGFFSVLGLSVPLFNASLSIFYVMSIRYNMSTQDYLDKFEPWSHILCFGLPLSTAIYATIKKAMHPIVFTCFARGKRAPILVGFMLLLPCFICIVSMALVAHTMMMRSKTMKRFTSPTSFGSSKKAMFQEGSKRGDKQLVPPFPEPNSAVKGSVYGENQPVANTPSDGRNLNIHNSAELRTNQKNSRNSRLQTDLRDTVVQATAFSCALFVTYLFPAILTFGYTRGNSKKSAPVVINILLVIFYPLQGFWNFLLFIYPSVIHLRRMYLDMSFHTALYQVVFKASLLGHDNRRISITARRASQTRNKLPPVTATTSFLRNDNSVSNLERKKEYMEKGRNSAALRNDKELDWNRGDMNTNKSSDELAEEGRGKVGEPQDATDLLEEEKTEM